MRFSPPLVWCLGKVKLCVTPSWSVTARDGVVQSGALSIDDDAIHCGTNQIFIQLVASPHEIDHVIDQFKLAPWTSQQPVYGRLHLRGCDPSRQRALWARVVPPRWKVARHVDVPDLSVTAIETRHEQSECVGRRDITERRGERSGRLFNRPMSNVRGFNAPRHSVRAETVADHSDPAGQYECLFHPDGFVIRIPRKRIGSHGDQIIGGFDERGRHELPPARTVCPDCGT
jgi:hypothetical protein